MYKRKIKIDRVLEYIYLVVMKKNIEKADVPSIPNSSIKAENKMLFQPEH